MQRVDARMQHERNGRLFVVRVFCQKFSNSISQTEQIIKKNMICIGSLRRGGGSQHCFEFRKA